MKIRSLVLVASLILIAGCGGGTVTTPAAPPAQTQSGAGLLVGISIPNPDSAVTSVSLTATPADGSAPTTGVRACSPSGCVPTLFVTPGGNTLRIDLMDSQNHVLRSGSLYVRASAPHGKIVGVAFGGVPAILKLSVTPATFKSGTAATATVRIIAYDAQGNRMIGNIPFPTTVGVSSTDTTGTLSLSGTTIDAPHQTLNLNYNGGNGAASTTLTPSASPATSVPEPVAIVAPPHKTINGDNSGDFQFSPRDQIEAIPTAPPVPPLLAIMRHPLTNPSIVDLSAQMPPVGNQRDENSCVGWASAYAIKSYEEAQEHQWSLTGSGPFGIATPHVFSPAFVYNQLNGGVDNGIDFVPALDLLENQGVAPWSSMPYVAGDYLTQPTAAQKTAALPYVISTYYTIPKTNLAQVKSYLAAGYPIFWGAEVDSVLETGTFGVLDGPFATDEGGHAMVLVGYDDTKQAFKVMNSWGTTWGGQGGYFYVSYNWWQNNGQMSLNYVLVDALNDP